MTNNYIELKEIKETSQLLKDNDFDIINTIDPKYKRIRLDNKNRLIIENSDDFYNTMECLRYHMVSELPTEILTFVKNTEESLDLFRFNDFFLDDLVFAKFIINKKLIKTDRSSLEHLQKVCKKSIAYFDAKKKEKIFKKNYHKYGKVFTDNKDVIDKMDYYKYTMNGYESNGVEQITNVKFKIRIDENILYFRLYNWVYDYDGYTTKIVWGFGNKKKYHQLLYQQEKFRYSDGVSKYQLSYDNLKKAAKIINLKYDNIEDIFDFFKHVSTLEQVPGKSWRMKSFDTFINTQGNLDNSYSDL